MRDNNSITKPFWRDVTDEDVWEAISGSFLGTICRAFAKNYTPVAPLPLILMQGIVLMAVALTHRKEGAYYKEGLKPVSIYVEDEYVRAVRGGVGFTKCAGNYAASILAGDIAEKKGFSQVLWLDGVEQKYVEEVGSMNMMFAYGNKIVTPKLNGSILPGITRDSVLKLAVQLGYEAEEKRLDVNEIFADAKSGKLTEAFGTGTAAVISPVGVLALRDEKVTLGDGGIGVISQKLYDTLTGIQYGKLEDRNGWILKL